MIIDHVTYEVPEDSLFNKDDGSRRSVFTEFFVDLLGMKEIDPDEGIEGKGWVVRWFEDDRGFKVHLVEPKLQLSEAEIGLGHFCAVIDRGAYSRALEGAWREDVGSLKGRAWLQGPGGVRVEIRPKPLLVDNPHLDISRAAAHRIDDLDPSKLVDPGCLLTEDQMRVVFERCLRIFDERNKQHNDSWKREGWRGCLFNLRRKVERAWDYLWDYDLAEVPDPPDVDDLLDSINYAALAVLAVEEGNRDGKGGWWG